MSVILIQGSSRSFGHSRKVVSFLEGQLTVDFIDLLKYNIGPYDYEHKNKTDDFLPLIKQVIDNNDTIIFITPVYWYTMSGILKTFLDRFSDLLQIEKELGRKLRGKNLAVISCSEDANKVVGFFQPFRQSADYLGMNYLGDVHAALENENVSLLSQIHIKEFCNKITAILP